MKLGSHNSMTYLPPKHWWMKPFNFIARCQSLSIKEQYEYGVRLFDIRIAYDKKLKPEFRHGSMTYKGNVYDVLKYLNSVDESVYVRLWLEKGSKQEEELFKRECSYLEKEYFNIRFYGGQRKKDQKVLYKFFNNRPDMIEIYSSYQLPKIDDMYPKLYAKNHNAQAKLIKADYVMLDFVQIG